MRRARATRPIGAIGYLEWRRARDNIEEERSMLLRSERMFYYKLIAFFGLLSCFSFAGLLWAALW